VAGRRHLKQAHPLEYAGRSIMLGKEEPPFITVSFTRDGHLLST
jgi:hypothetical protein